MPAIRTATCLRPCGYSGHGTGKGTEQNGHFFLPLALLLAHASAVRFLPGFRCRVRARAGQPASQPATVRPARRNSRRHSRLGIRCLWLTPCRAAGGGAGSLVRRRRYAGGWCHPPPALLRPRFRPASPRRTGRWLGVTSPHARTGRRARRQARLRQDPAEVDWSRPRRAPPCTPLVVVGRPARAVTSRPRPLPSHPSGFRKYLRCGRSKRAGKDDPS